MVALKIITTPEKHAPTDISLCGGGGICVIYFISPADIYYPREISRNSQSNTYATGGSNFGSIKSIASHTWASSICRWMRNKLELSWPVSQSVGLTCQWSWNVGINSPAVPECVNLQNGNDFRKSSINLLSTSWCRFSRPS